MRARPADAMKGSDSATLADVDRALTRTGPLSLADVAALLSTPAGVRIEMLARRAHAATRARFGRAIRMFAPLYLSNECVNVCRYCGFSVGNRIRRRTLSVDEVSREWEHLAGQGFRHVLLVAGEDDRFVPLDYLRAAVGALKPSAASVAIEVAPMEEDGYRECVESGVDTVVAYQETVYNLALRILGDADRARYAEIHPKGPKRDYDWRLAALERAGAAGVRRLGMGVLLGLADWRSDILALVAHARRLEKAAWRSEITVSVPRLRPAAGGYVPPVPVHDAALVQIIAVLRLALPDAGIVLSTRESETLRDHLARLGVTHMSAGSRTEPGGYVVDGEADHAEPQFDIADVRSPAEVAARLAALGYEPVWKDWEAAFGRVMGHGTRVMSEAGKAR